MWSKVDVSGAPPPARLDHAMCSINIPVPSTSIRGKTTPKNHAQENLITAKASNSGGSLAESNQSCLSSFQAVTVIDPVDTSGSSFSVSERQEEERITAEEKVAGQLESLSVREGEMKDCSLGCEWVSALFVFGGMDIAGTVHGDAFIFVP